MPFWLAEGADNREAPEMLARVFVQKGFYASGELCVVFLQKEAEPLRTASLLILCSFYRLFNTIAFLCNRELSVVSFL